MDQGLEQRQQERRRTEGGEQDGLIKFISTGRVKMREPMNGQPVGNSNTLLRKLRCFRGKWTRWVPIGVFVIRHADGPILIDTGSSPECMNPGYFPAYSLPVTILTQLDVPPSTGIISQLAQHGITPADLQAVVLTHLHHDHAGGLEEVVKAAPNVPVYVDADHWEAFGKHPVFAAIRGCAPNHWPTSFEPELLHFNGRGVGPWTKSSSITADGTVVAVQTPGHVIGHLSIIVTDGPSTYLIAGDATYNLDSLEKETPDGGTDDPLTAYATLRLMKEFARQEDVIVLPSHDADTPQLLREKRIYKPADARKG